MEVVNTPKHEEIGPNGNLIEKMPTNLSKTADITTTTARRQKMETKIGLKKNQGKKMLLEVSTRKIKRGHDYIIVDEQVKEEEKGGEEDDEEEVIEDFFESNDAENLTQRKRKKIVRAHWGR